MLNQNSLALKDFNAVLQDDPTDCMALTNRGVIFMKYRNKPQALLNFDRALAINPKFELAMQNKAKLLSNQPPT